MNTNKKTQEFMELRDVWGNHAKNQIRVDKTIRLVKGLFKIGIVRQIKIRINQKSITNAILIINTAIPCTVWPVTNPIIKKISNKIDPDKIGRKINCFRIRFR